MRYKDHIPRIILKKILHLPLKHILQKTIQCGKRFIQKDCFRLSDHHSGQRHSLLLPSGKLGGKTFFQPFQMISPDQIRHFFLGGGFFSTVTTANVLFYCHGRKQRIILEEITNPPFLWFQIDSCFRIKDCFSVNYNLTPIRSFNSCYTPQCHALSAAGCSKKPDGCRAALKLYFQGKIPEILFDIYTDCHQIHLLVFIPLPDTMLISATITKEISTITTTQKPAVP